MSTNRLTRADIARIVPGAVVRRTYDLGPGLLPVPNARWGDPVRVTSVHARGDNICGQAFVCFYTEHGPGSQLSGSITEGEGHVRIERDAPDPRARVGGGDRGGTPDPAGNSGPGFCGWLVNASVTAT